MHYCSMHQWVLCSVFPYFRLHSVYNNGVCYSYVSNIYHTQNVKRYVTVLQCNPKLWCDLCIYFVYSAIETSIYYTHADFFRALLGLQFVDIALQSTTATKSSFNLYFHVFTVYLFRIWKVHLLKVQRGLVLRVNDGKW